MPHQGRQGSGPGFFEELFGEMLGGVKSRGNEMGRVYANFARSFARDIARWTAISASGARCMLPLIGAARIPFDCANPAIGQCDICHMPTCLEHAMIAPGKIVCLGCVEAARVHFPAVAASKGARWAPPPFATAEPGAHQRGRQDDPRHGNGHEDPRAARRRHLDTLGLPEGALDADIHARFRELAKRYHPDRAPEHLRDECAQKMSVINAAFTWLKEHREAA